MIESNFPQFIKQYNISLNEQQEQAAQVIEGAHLLVAVPGSGKTTVLITRLAYMTMFCNVNPRRVLAITYNTTAANEMRERFATKFDREIADKIDFRTINSLGEMIVREVLKAKGVEWTLLNGDKRHVSAVRKEFRNIFQKDIYDDDYYASDNEIDDVFREIAFIKNLELSVEDIKSIKFDTPQIEDFYELYHDYLKENKLYDYDDQILHAISSLEKNAVLLERYQGKYDFICVDEAQDTSKTQHELLRLLAGKHNNIFMVGDDDQSIYGFRGAFPHALMSFKDDYPNSNVMYMEKNYRSTQEIVSTAAKFIKNSKAFRYDKNFISMRENGTPVERVALADRNSQYWFLLSQIEKNTGNDMAVLFRNNDCSIPLVDLLIRKNIAFNSRSKKEQYDKFFKHPIVDDIKAFFSLALDPYDSEAFLKIYHKCGLYIKKKTAEWTARNSRRNHITVCEAFKEQMNYYGGKYSVKGLTFERMMSLISSADPQKAISHIISGGYERYLAEKELDSSKIEILKALASQESTLQGFMARLDALPLLIQEKIDTSGVASVTISTAHSSKGLEFDTVYIFDVFDGIFPNVEKDEIKAPTEKYYEERRLFYVAMTRAKNRLVITDLKDRYSTFLTEIFNKKADVKSDVIVKEHSSKSQARNLIADMTIGSTVSMINTIFPNEDIDDYNVGDIVIHRTYGKGRIVEKKESGKITIIRIKYDNGETLSYDIAILIKNNMIAKL